MHALQCLRMTEVKQLKVGPRTSVKMGASIFSRSHSRDDNPTRQTPKPAKASPSRRPKHPTFVRGAIGRCKDSEFDDNGC